MKPRKIGRYELKTELGRGGMATVFHAHDPRFRRDVALKVLPRRFLHDPTFRTRFEREAQTIASLEHPAIVPVYDFGEEDGQLYLVMRFLSGGSLAKHLKQGSFSFQETVRITTQVALGLDEAHRQGLIHRDLKPDNILFDQRQDPFITDFGIVKLSQKSKTLTMDYAVIGTPGYMSPEQINGKEVDKRSDIYALGVIVFQMLAGKLPYEADTPVGLMMQHIIEPVPDILTIKPDLPPDCAAIIDRAMAKEPDERYPTATALAEALTGLIDNQLDSQAELPSQEASEIVSPHQAPTMAMRKATVSTEIAPGLGAPKSEKGDEAPQEAQKQISEQKDAAQSKENLSQILKALADSQEQKTAIKQLTQMSGNEKVLKALIETLLKDKNPQARSGSAKALGQIHQESTVQIMTKTGITRILIRALADPEPEVRYSVATVLGTFEGRFGQLAIKPLSALLKDREEKVRQQAHRSLQELQELQEIGETEIEPEHEPKVKAEIKAPSQKTVDAPAVIQLNIGHNKREVKLPLNKAIHLGRLDPENGFFPEVDLTRDKAVERGISRRHARIAKEGDQVIVEDLGSINGTFINGKRLPPYSPQALQHDDQLYLGSLAIKVNFVSR